MGPCTGGAVRRILGPAQTAGRSPDGRGTPRPYRRCLSPVLEHRHIHFERRRQYPMSVDEAWRLLADTNHLNRAIGLPAVSFSPLDGARSTFTRSARSRAFGLIPLSWKEYPFDWVRNRSYKVRREFDQGPLAVLEGGIELEPAGSETIVKAFADYTPA